MISNYQKYYIAELVKHLKLNLSYGVSVLEEYETWRQVQRKSAVLS